MLRKVIYSEYEMVENSQPQKEGFTLAPSKSYVLVEKGEAIFQTFGVNCQEFNNGVGTFTSAIIELSDGALKNLPVEQVKFIS